VKPVLFVNQRNGDRVVCDNVREIQTIDGVEYLTVHQPNNTRTFLMRKDALTKVLSNA
jgi:hypothetical protein